MDTKVLLIFAALATFSEVKCSIFFRNVDVDSVSWSSAIPTMVDKIV